MHKVKILEGTGTWFGITAIIDIFMILNQIIKDSEN